MSSWRQALLLLLLPCSAGGQPLPTTDIPDAYTQLWLDEVAPFITDAERTRFEQLANDFDREAFKRSFWRARDPAPNLALQPLKEQYLNHLHSARQHGLPMSDQRSQVLLMHGPPMVFTVHGNCGEEPANRLLASNCVVSRSFNLIDHGNDARVGWAPILFVQHDNRCVLYRKDLEPPFLIHRHTPQTCSRPRYSLPGRITSAMKAHLTWQEVVERGLQANADPSWLDDFTGAPPSDPLGQVSVTILRRGRRTLSDGSEVHTFDTSLTMPAPESWSQSPLPWRNLFVRSDIFENGAKVAGFDYQELLFDRRLEVLDLPMALQMPEGSYTVVLHVEDPSLELFRTAALRFEVPVPDADPESQPEYDARASSMPGGVFEPVNAANVRIRALNGLAVGELPITLDRWRGPIEGRGGPKPIERVDYRLDDQVIGSSDEPPFEAILDFGPIPRERVLSAHAYLGGRVVAMDRFPVNVGVHDFDIELTRTSSSSDSYSVRGRVSVPRRSNLTRVELYDVTDPESPRRLLETKDPTFSAVVEGGSTNNRVTVLEGRATLTDGSSATDTLVVTSQHVDRVDVDLVEVFASITNRAGRPLTDLTADQFRIYEDGEPQTLRSFQHLDELPINVILLLDTSSTMAAEIEEVKESGLAFLENMIRQDDNASIIAFNHSTYVMVPFTNQGALLREASENLSAWGGTSLHDSAVLALYYLNGLPGKKALVLVSDGVEETSDLEFDQVVEFADRVDASVYTLALGLPGESPNLLAEARTRMRRIARQTGGAYFKVKGRKQIDEAYLEIEQDLRSQYLLTYESTALAKTGDDEYRSLEIKVSAGGARIRARPGYFP